MNRWFDQKDYKTDHLYCVNCGTKMFFIKDAEYFKVCHNCMNKHIMSPYAKKALRG
jgi:hypothetical protein